MNLPASTLDYLSHATPNGERNKRLFDAACQFRDAQLTEADAESQLVPCAVRDGLPESEARTAIRSAYRGNQRAPVHRYGGAARPAKVITRHTEPATSSTVPIRQYESHTTEPLPQPIADGTRQLLMAAFMAGEGIAIVPGRNGDDCREIPEHEGIVLTRDEWIKKLDAHNGNPNGIFTTPHKNGIFVKVNPLGQGKGRDSDVTAFRHVLVEWDNISIDEQWALIVNSNIPCTAVIASGGKSLHAWVRVDAKDRREYDDRVRAIYTHFDAYGLDKQNKNPARFSRLPNCVRGNKRQELLSLKRGAEDFITWLSDLQADSAGETVTVDDLLSYDTSNDPNNVIGKRWLCRGVACLIVGQSGTGKSSLAVQLAATWALGMSAWGIDPIRPLKSLFIQAENDKGDLAEMLCGVIRGFDKAPDQSILNKNLIFVRETTHTGEAFTQTIRRLIDKHKPDLVWMDPLLSFIGDDISKQDVCSQFLRGWLNPISEATGVIWMMVHHTCKPSKDPKSKASWLSTDYSYEGAGSSELTNWARAVCVLHRVDESRFELKLAKRGERANATNRDGRPTRAIWLQHSPDSIRWIQIEEEEPKSAQDKPDNQPKLSGFLEHIGSQTLKWGDLIKQIREYYGIAKGTAVNKWSDELIHYFIKDEDSKLYSLKPQNEPY